MIEDSAFVLNQVNRLLSQKKNVELEKRRDDFVMAQMAEKQLKAQMKECTAALKKCKALLKDLGRRRRVTPYGISWDIAHVPDEVIAELSVASRSALAQGRNRSSAFLDWETSLYHAFESAWVKAERQERQLPQKIVDLQLALHRTAKLRQLCYDKLNRLSLELEFEGMRRIHIPNSVTVDNSEEFNEHINAMGDINLFRILLYEPKDYDFLKRYDRVAEAVSRLDEAARQLYFDYRNKEERRDISCNGLSNDELPSEEEYRSKLAVLNDEICKTKKALQECIQLAEENMYPYDKSKAIQVLDKIEEAIVKLPNLIKVWRNNNIIASSTEVSHVE